VVAEGVKIAASAVESGPPDRLTIGFSEITYRIPRPGSCSAPHLRCILDRI
jgi:hypothetical protein